MDGGAWWAVVHGVPEGQIRLSVFTFTFHFHALKKEMAIHSIVLAWRIPGMVEPGGLPSMGLHRVGHNRSNLAAAAAAKKSKSYRYADYILSLLISCWDFLFSRQVSYMILLVLDFNLNNNWISVKECLFKTMTVSEQVDLCRAIYWAFLRPVSHLGYIEVIESIIQNCLRKKMDCFVGLLSWKYKHRVKLSVGWFKRSVLESLILSPLYSPKCHLLPKMSSDDRRVTVSYYRRKRTPSPRQTRRNFLRRPQ